MKRIMGCLAALLVSPTALYALDCMPLALPVGRALSALNKEEPGLQECNKKSNNQESEQCFTDAISNLANNGNYWAAVGLASNACEADNAAEVNKWLTTAINNPKISPEYKEELTKVLKTFSTGQ